MKKIALLIILLMVLFGGCKSKEISGFLSNFQVNETPLISETANYQVSLSDVVQYASTTPVHTRIVDVSQPSVITTPENTNTVANTPLVTYTKLSHEGCIIGPFTPSLSALNVNWVLPLLSTSYKASESFTINLITGEKFPFPYSPVLSENEIFVLGGAVSPDGNWLAYVTENGLDVESQLLTIVNTDGEILKTILLSKELHPFQIVKVEQWLDSERLILVWPGYKADHGETNPQGLTPIGSTTVVLNPFTEEWVEYGSDYPDIFTRFPEFTNLWNTSNYSLQVYNNSFDRTLYLSKEGLALWDVAQQQQIKVFLDDPISSKSKPSWSAEGDKFLVDLKTSQGYNLFMISKDGVQSQVTFLQGYKAGDITNYSWSPDEKSIAFWLRSEEKDDSTSSTNYKLSILDLATSESRDFCISSYMWRLTIPRWYPIWSPDGKYLVVFAQNETDPEKGMGVLVDIENNQLYKIEDNVIPLGWMVSE